MLRLVIFCCALAALPDVARANSGFEQDLTGWTTDGDGAAVKDPALNEAVPLRLGPAPRVALLLVFLASLILLSGCAPKTSVGGGSPLVSLPAGQANGSLTVWSWSIAAKSLQDLTPAFEKQDPHAKVEVDMTGARMTTRLMLSLAAGVGAPDVSQLQCQDAPHYSVTGRLTDLTPVAGRYKALFPASLWDNCTLKGRVYAIPWDIGPCAIFYKRGLFRRYGIDPTSIQTWDDYIQAGQVILHKSGGRTKMLPLGSNDMMGMFEILLQQTGGQVFDDQGRVAVGSPSAKQAVALLGRLRRAGICSDVPAYGQEWMAGFNDEIIATYPGAVWLGGIIKDSAGDYAGKSAEWGVFRLPAVTPGRAADRQPGRLGAGNSSTMPEQERGMGLYPVRTLHPRRAACPIPAQPSFPRISARLADLGDGRAGSVLRGTGCGTALRDGCCRLAAPGTGPPPGPKRSLMSAKTSATGRQRACRRQIS